MVYLLNKITLYKQYIMEQVKYVFIKEFKTQDGNIPQGTEIILFRGFVYMNGGMVHPAYNNILINIINNQKLHDEYLREVNIIHNKL